MSCVAETPPKLITTNAGLSGRPLQLRLERASGRCRYAEGVIYNPLAGDYRRTPPAALPSVQVAG